MMASSSSSSLARGWMYHVFPSFHGPDVRKGFLSHVLEKFNTKGIIVFIDNEIKRGESIGQELVGAIRHSRVAVVLLSPNYASSSWCLDELVEIMKCRKEYQQTVLTIFYDVNPTDVRKQTGDFGKAFDITCVGKTEKVKQAWREALKDVAGIAGYHSSNCDNEADLINKVASDVMAVLDFTPSRDFDDFVGLEARITKIKSKLIRQSEEVKVIGIFGPGGIGKTTTARVLYNQLSPDFQFSTFLENIRGSYEKPCGNDYQLKLRLQKNLLCQILNKGDIEVHHLRRAQEMLSDKKVLVVLDEVDNWWQLEEMAKQGGWVGPGSMIIITTEDRKLLKALQLGSNHIYKMKYPTSNESLQIFCQYAFRQKYPADGFESLAREVTWLAGDLPLGLRVMGSYLRGMTRDEWIEALPWLRSTLDREIESTLRFSYDALGDNERTLFLHIACLFDFVRVDSFKRYFANSGLEVNHGLEVLAQKSLISIKDKFIKKHRLLEQMGREIVKKQSMENPAKPHFLTDTNDISDALDEDTASGNVLGITLSTSETIKISKSAFKGMDSLQFLYFDSETTCTPESLDCLPDKLILLHWEECPLRFWPSKFSGKFLVEIIMPNSKFEMLWEGIQPLPCLKVLDLSSSCNLKMIPDLSKATSLEELRLLNCESLLEVTNSIGNATKFYRLDISWCTNIKDFPNVPDSIVKLDLRNTGIKEVPPWIKNLFRLRKLIMDGCEKLQTISPNISKLENLEFLCLRNYDCRANNTFEATIEWGPDFKRSWTLQSDLDIHYILPICLPEQALTSPISLRLYSTIGIKTIPDCIRRLSGLIKLDVKQCEDLVALPPLPDSLLSLDVHRCQFLKRIDSSFQNPNICLNFAMCLNLEQKARKLIQTSACKYAVLPGWEVPAHFTHQASSGSLTINLTPRPLPSSFRFKACILLSKVYKNPWGVTIEEGERMSCSVRAEQNGVTVGGGSVQLHMPTIFISAIVGYTSHLYIFEDSFTLNQDCPGAEKPTFSELTFVFRYLDETWEVKECGVRLLKVPHCILDGKETEDQECMGINIEANDESAGGRDEEKDDDADEYDDDDEEYDVDDEEYDDADDDDADPDPDDDDDNGGGGGVEEDDGDDDDYYCDDDDYDDSGDGGKEDHVEDDKGGYGDNNNKVVENDDVMLHSFGSHQSSPHSIVVETECDANGSSQISHIGTPLASNVDENVQGEFSSRISVSRPKMSLIREPSISSDRKFGEQADETNKMALLKNDSGFVPGSTGQNLIDPRVGPQGFYSESSQQQHSGHIHGGFSSRGVYYQKMLQNQPPLPLVLPPPSSSHVMPHSSDSLSNQSSPFSRGTPSSGGPIRHMPPHPSAISQYSSNPYASLPPRTSKVQTFGYNQGGAGTTEQQQSGPAIDPQSVSHPEMSLIREPSISSFRNIPGSTGQNLIDSRVGPHGFYSRSSQQQHAGHIHGGFNTRWVYDKEMLPNQPPLCNTLMQSGFSRQFYGNPMHQGGDKPQNMLPVPQSLDLHSIPQQLPWMQLQRPMQPPQHVRPSIQYICQPSEQGVSLQNQYQIPLHPMQMMQQTQVQPYYHVQQQPQAVQGQQGAGTSQRQESGMSLHDYLQSPETIQALLSNREKLRELLEQNQKLMQMLQEKLGQL